MAQRGRDGRGHRLVVGGDSPVISNTTYGAQAALMSVRPTGGFTSVSSQRGTQAAWRAVESAAYGPMHAPAALLKRDAFAPSGTRGGGPPV
jgi:hypothetical protein